MQVDHIVFQPPKPPPTTVLPEFIPLEHSYRDDELVYALSMESPEDSTTSRAHARTGSRELPSKEAFPKGTRLKEQTPPKFATGPARLAAVPMGKKQLSFKGFLTNEYCLFPADSGATNSFVSSDFCAEHGLSMFSHHFDVTPADGSVTSIIGYVDVMVKLGLLLR